MKSDSRLFRLLRRARQVYVCCAVALLSSVVLLVAFTLFVALAYSFKDAMNSSAPFQVGDALFEAEGRPVDNGMRTAYQNNYFDFTATSEVGEEYAAEVLDDFFLLSQLGFAFQPWVGFSEPEYRGKRLSVKLDPAGFPVRNTANPKRDPSRSMINIYTFGGSTTFGYSVSDEHTWPSFLSNILNERAESAGLGIQVIVSNYGRGYFNTSQEMVLAQDLLKSGRLPNVALFMDGVNWGPNEDVPKFTEEMTEAFWKAQHPSFAAALEQVAGVTDDFFPYGRLSKSIARRLKRNVGRESDTGPSTDEWSPVQGLDATDTLRVAQTVQRFRMNRAIIQNVYGMHSVKTVFFIQPDGNYNYPVELYRPGPRPHWWWRQRSRRQLFHPLIRSDAGVVYLGNLFEAFGTNEGRKALIDNVHYSPRFNRFLAQRVADEIDLESLAILAEPPARSGEARSGAPVPERVHLGEE